MKKRILLTLISLVVSAAPLPLTAIGLCPEYALPPALDSALNNFGQQLTVAHMRLVAKNAILSECGTLFDRVDVIVDSWERLDVAQARILMVSLTYFLLQTLDSDPELKNYFSRFPLTPDDVSIQVRIQYDQCNPLTPPLGNIAYITLMEGQITYSTYNTHSGMLALLYREDYKTAGKLVYELPPPS